MANDWLSRPESLGRLYVRAVPKVSDCWIPVGLVVGAELIAAARRDAAAHADRQVDRQAPVGVVEVELRDRFSNSMSWWPPKAWWPRHVGAVHGHDGRLTEVPGPMETPKRRGRKVSSGS